MDNVRCNGTEARLEDCYHLDSDDCDDLEGAGVVCRRGFNKLKQLVSIVKIITTINGTTHTVFIYSPNILQIRLTKIIDLSISL